jgi:hypothetical protein
LPMTSIVSRSTRPSRSRSRSRWSSRGTRTCNRGGQRTTEPRRRSTTTSRCSQARQRRMEPLWSAVVATSGSQRETAERRSVENKPNPLRSVATGCRAQRMVRRGRSTVRVRQRA